MPLSSNLLSQITQSYFTALSNQTAIEPMANLCPDLTMVEGYQVQDELVSMFEGQGHQIVGYKCASTSVTAQEKMGISEPIYGKLFNIHQAFSDASLPADTFIQSFIECELAFIIRDSLSGPGLTAADVLAATDYIVAAFDIIDFRAIGWQVGLGEALCTNVYARHFVLSEYKRDIDALDLPHLGITLYKNDEAVATATADAVMGHPARPIAWLVNKLAEHDRHLEPGQFALTGAITRPHPIAAGDRFEAVFQDLGSLQIRFS